MQFFLIHSFDCLAVSFFLLLLVKFRDNRRRRGLPYPPGPPSWPIIGNYLDVPTEKPWVKYTEMYKIYGGCNIHSWGRRFSQLKWRSKAMSAVFALFLKSSSCCLPYHPSRISLRCAGSTTQRDLIDQWWKCVFCIVFLSRSANTLTIFDP